MLMIQEHHLEEIRNLAKGAHPLEFCGVMAGAAGANVPQRVIPMQNAARSECFFQFEPAEQLRVWRELDLQNEVPMVIFHSHTGSEAVPSRTDIEYAAEPDAHYLIVSTLEGVTETARSFRIFNGRVVEENLKIISSGKKHES